MAMTENASEVLDVAIIGAGPAGLTAGIYAARAGLSCAMFERLTPGGQLALTEHLENYPGFTQSTSGFELTMMMHGQASTFGARTISEEVTSVEVEGDIKRIITPFAEYAARTVIVASGSRPATLGLPGEEALIGHGVSYCATCDGNFFRGQDAVIVGGGDTAAADAIYLSRICRKVTIVHRRDVLRATPVYHERLAEIENLEFAWNSEVVEYLVEDGAVEGVKLRDVNDGSLREIPCKAVFIAIGSRPNTEFLGGAVTLDEAGYVIAGEDGTTNVAGVYAAGDVRTKALRQAVTAVADGARCADGAADLLAE